MCVYLPRGNTCHDRWIVAKDFPFLSRLECVCVYFTFNTHAGHVMGVDCCLKICIEVQEELGVPLPL